MLMSLKKSSHQSKTFQPNNRKLSRKTGQKNQSMKNFYKFNKKIWEKNQKIILLIKKPFNLNLGQERENQRFVKRETG